MTADLRALIGRTALAEATDADLLGRYATERDDLAFAELVHRHAPAVYAACRRFVSAPADLDDAFQAVFVLLSQKAGAIGDPSRLSGWLCGTAGRIARKVKGRSARRTATEQPLEAVPEPAATPADSTDLKAVLDEELARLPAAYRVVVLLCDVDGLSRRTAAKRLGIPESTLSNRLARARAMLGGRLLRRGVALGVGLSLTSVAVASVPAKLVPLTVLRITTATVPPDLLALASEGVPAMLPLKTAGVFLAGLIALGLGFVAPAAGEPVKSKPPAAKEPVEPPDPEPEQLKGWAPGAAFSRDGKLLALTMSDTKTIRLYDTSTWKVIHTLEGPKEVCHAAVFSADGKTLYSACYDGKVYTWDTKTGKAGDTLDPQVGPCTGLILSPDGKVLASGHHSTDGKTTSIELWDATTGKPLRSLKADVPLLANSIAFAPDGKTIAGGYHASHIDPTDLAGFHGVIEWAVGTGKEAKRTAVPRTKPGDSPVVHTVGYTTDGKKLIVGGGAAEPTQGGGCFCIGYLWVFDRKTGELDRTVLENVRTDYVRQFTLSADGRKLYVPTHTPRRKVMRNGVLTEMSFSSLQCWDTQTWEMDWAHEGEPNIVTCLTVSPNGKRVVVSDTSGCYLLDAATGEPKGGLVKAPK